MNETPKRNGEWIISIINRTMKGRDVYDTIRWCVNGNTNTVHCLSPTYSKQYNVYYQYVVPNVDRCGPNTVIPVRVCSWDHQQLTNFAIDCVNPGEMGAVFLTCYREDYAQAIDAFTQNNPTYKVYVIGGKNELLVTIRDFWNVLLLSEEIGC